MFRTNRQNRFINLHLLLGKSPHNPTIILLPHTPFKKLRMHLTRNLAIQVKKHDSRSQSVESVTGTRVHESELQSNYCDDTVLVIAARGMDGDAGWLVDYKESCCRVVVDYSDGTGGHRRFVTVNSMRNAISILNHVVFINDFAVYRDGSFCNGRFIVLGLSVSKF